ncbi:MAG: bifunctional folylpolyglutamate synthase/dihydrofolate synthase [Alphaproteobacteria bacterium]
MALSPVVPGDAVGPRKSEALLSRLMSLHPRYIDLHLGRIERLLDALGAPHKALAPVLHVAGTNGKGSTVAFLKAMLEADGYSVHCYTSPHLVSFHERIVLNGLPIGEDALCDVLETCERVNNGAEITHFEITTAAAFLAFARHPADAVLLEVGLGGRLDATNVIDRPAASLIMPVDLDHREYLGETLSLIAGEKAGILKPGAPGFVARQHDEARAVIEAYGAQVGAPLRIFGQDFMSREENGRLVYEDGGGLLDLPLPRLEGRHQIENAGVAIAALRHQTALPVSVNGIEGGLRAVFWPARLQRLTRGPLVRRLQGAAADPKDGADLWLDGGHNAHAAAAVAQVMADLDQRVPRPLFLICAMMKNKDAPAFFAHFVGLAAHIVAVPLPGTSPGWPPDELAAAARAAGMGASVAGSVEEAVGQSLTHALADQAKTPRILVCGSLYLAGAVLQDHG